MGEKLRRPLLIEAVCEFRFSDKGAWDWAIPGLLYERLNGEFSERRQVQMQEFGVRMEQVNEEPMVAIRPPRPARMQFCRPDGSALVQVGPHLLSVNHLRPYPAWEDFRQLILRVLGEYQAIATGTSLQRIGLRYINQVQMAGEQPNVADYLTLVPPLSRSLYQPVKTFYQRYELFQTTPPGVLIHQTGTQPADEDLPLLILDLDFVSGDVAQLGGEHELASWLDAAHARVYEAFVDSLNPKFYTQLRMGEA